MKRIGLIGGGVIALLAVIIGIAPYLVPSEVYRTQIEKQAEAALGREVTLDGEARLSILPSIAARVEGVKVANPEGFSEINIIEAGELRARVKLLPLLMRRVEIAEISLVDANVSLERMADGTANWEFGRENDSSSEPPESGSAIDAGIDRARLINSSLSYKDEIAGAHYSFTELTAKATMRALDKPLAFEGSGKLNGEAFGVFLDLDSIDALINGDKVVTEIELTTDLGSIEYDGELSLGELPELSGAFDVSSEHIDTIASVLGLDLGIDLAALGKLDARGDISGTIEALKIELERAAQRSDFFSASYSGLIDLGSNLPLDGTFAFKTDDTARAANALNLNLPLQLSPIGSIDIAGKIEGSFSSPKLTFEKFRQNSGFMNTDYFGLIILQDDPALDGSLKFSSSDAGRALTLLGMDGGPINVLEQVSFSGDLSGPLSKLNITESSLTHQGALLDVDYKGDVAFGQDGTISGPLSASSSNFRGLLDALGVELAPGETLRSFDMTGTLSGTPQNFSMASLNMTIDDVEGSGTAGLDTRGDVPKLIADLSLPQLDLSPFLGESSGGQTAASNGWSTAPLALDGLRAVDADIEMKSEVLKVGELELQNSDISATLTGGNLNADIASITAFDGQWSGDLQLDASHEIPRLAIDMRGSDVAMKSVLSTFANLQSVSGTGGMSFKATSRGSSPDALIRGLNGELKTDLANGAVKGFNLAQIVRSRGDIVAALTSGSIDFALSPEAETDFTELNSALTITNGVANIDILRALNPAVLLDGKGGIDLVNQSIDISFTPSIDASGAGDLGMLKLNGEPFAIPFRVYDKWSSPRIAIDTGAIAGQLRTRATDQIGDRIADELSGVLGDALGGGKRKTAPEQEGKQENAPGEAPPAEADDSKKGKSPEDAIEDVAKDALKDLFGRRN